MATSRSQGGIKSLFDELENMVNSGLDMVGKQVSRAYPVIDILEDSHGYLVSADLPGLKKEEIQITIDQGILHIAGFRKSPSEKMDKSSYYKSERTYGKIERRINLPENIDTSNLKASYTDGVLEIFLKKTQEDQPQTVKININ